MTALPSDSQALLSNPYLLWTILDELAGATPPALGAAQSYASYPAVPVPAAGFVTLACRGELVIRLSTPGLPVFSLEGTLLYTVGGGE